MVRIFFHVSRELPIKTKNNTCYCNIGLPNIKIVLMLMSTLSCNKRAFPLQFILKEDARYYWLRIKTYLFSRVEKENKTFFPFVFLLLVHWKIQCIERGCPHFFSLKYVHIYLQPLKVESS